MNDEMKAGYDRAKELAKEIWFDTNEAENASSRYFCNCGYAAGLKQQNLTTEEIDAIRCAINACNETVRYDSIATLRNLLERTKDN